MCVWLSFQTKEVLFTALRLTFYVNYKRLLHLIAIFRSVSDSTRVIALRYVTAGSLLFELFQWL